MVKAKKYAAFMPQNASSLVWLVSNSWSVCVGMDDFMTGDLRIYPGGAKSFLVRNTIREVVVPDVRPAVKEISSET